MIAEVRALELRDRISRARRVYLIGNGGSYANAAHLAGDLLACGIRAFVIDPANLTRLANDYGWSEVFARWIRVVGKPGDLLIALSGSGTSPNILRACAEAERLEMDVWREFGAAQGLDMQAAEERQIWLGHRVRALLGGAVPVWQVWHSRATTIHEGDRCPVCGRGIIVEHNGLLLCSESLKSGCRQSAK